MNRRRFLQAAFTTVSGGLLAVTGGYLHVNGEMERLVIDRVSIPIKNLPLDLEGFSIVQMSDFHLQPHTTLDFIETAIQTADTLRPDLVAFTGDFVWREQPDLITDLAPLLASLNAKYGAFAILGNHDVFLGNGSFTAQTLEKAGIPVLENRGLSLQVGKAILNIAGLADAWHDQPDLKLALRDLPTAAPTILLAHEPDPADDYALDGRVSLQLSGHSHGGQIRIPGRGAPALPPFAYKYDQGLYNVNGMWVYTNRGIGTTGIPARFNCPPEITHITLVRA